MRVIDLTPLFARYHRINYYCLNPCITHVRDDIYAVVFRTIYYLLPEAIHPWGRWWSDLKLFEKYHPKCTSTCPQESIGKVQHQEICRENQARTLNHDVVPQQPSKIYRMTKVRQRLGPDYVVPLTDPNVSALDFNILDYDSTSLAIIQLDENKNITVLGVTNNLFQYEMNQDCRIHLENDAFVLTYNGFINSNVCMLQRLMYISNDFDHVYLTCESYCNETYKVGIEKNWTIFNERYYIYSMEDTIHFIKRNRPYNTESAENRRLMDQGMVVKQQEFNADVAPAAAQAPVADIAEEPALTLDEPLLDVVSEKQLDVEVKVEVDAEETAALVPATAPAIESGSIFDSNLDDVHIPTPEIGKLVRFYGGNKDMYFSLGTPCLPYEGGSISVGHIKIDHRKLVSGSNFAKFYKKYLDVPSKSIHKHGAYVYFMFIARFDQSGKLTHISNAFIPSQGNRHLPYYLVFAMGITQCDKTFYISYGEGDVRCKLLALTHQELSDLLIPLEDITPENYEFDLLTAMPKRRILVLGYYGCHNTGDECFGYIFEQLNRPDCTYVVRNLYKIDYIPNYINKIIVGGGDVLNPYFMDRINTLIKTRRKVSLVAFSVGIPYPDVISTEFLAPFSQIVLRNPLDVPFVKKYHPNVTYMPDLVFVLPKYIKAQPAFPIDKSCINVGVYLTRTIYRPGYEKDYFQLVNKLAAMFGQLLDNGVADSAALDTTPIQTPRQLAKLPMKSKYATLLQSAAGFSPNRGMTPVNSSMLGAPVGGSRRPLKLFFIPMGIDPNSNRENDIIINRHVSRIMKRNSNEAVFVDQVVNIEELTEKPYGYIPLFNHIVSQMDYAICMRFHAHIACILHKVPMSSIATTRKCDQLMREHGFDNNIVDMQLSKDFNPIDIDPCAATKIREHIENRHQMRQKLVEIMLKKTHDIARMEEFLYEIVNV